MFASIIVNQTFPAFYHIYTAARALATASQGITATALRLHKKEKVLFHSYHAL